MRSAGGYAGYALIEKLDFMRVERVRRKFGGEIGEQLAGAVHLMFALAGQRQQNFRERLQVVAMIGGELHLLHAL